MQEGRFVLALVAMVGLLALVAIISSAINMSMGAGARQPNVNVFGADYTRNAAIQPAAQAPSLLAYGGGATAGMAASRVFTIAIGHDNGAHEYFDDRGYLVGFGLELVNTVCDGIHIDCRIVWDKYERCWDSTPGEHSFGGHGLLGGWYDACIGWAPTVERLHVFSFSEPYLQPERSYFYTKKGGFLNADDISGKKIGFVDGWASDEKCLARQTDVTGRIKAANQVLYAKTSDELVSWMTGGQVDVGFATASAMTKHVEGGTVEVVKTKSFSCMIGGAAVMTRKDSDFTAYWNAGFNKVRANGQFLKLCDSAAKNHRLQGELHCVETY